MCTLSLSHTVFKTWTVCTFTSATCLCQVAFSLIIVLPRYLFFFFRLSLQFLISPGPLLFTLMSSHRMKPFKNAIPAAFPGAWSLRRLNEEWGPTTDLDPFSPSLGSGSLTDGRQCLRPCSPLCGFVAKAGGRADSTSVQARTFSSLKY